MRKSKVGTAIIGLDIGSDSVKMIKGTRKEGKICVLDFACREYSASETTPDLISQQINELLTGVAEVRKMRIHSTISGRKLCIRVVKLPVMPQGELHQAIRSTIRKYVTPDLDQVVFSFSVLGETQEKGIKKLEVVFVAIQKNLFDEYLQLFKLTGVEPKVITSACFSGWNLIRELGLDRGVNSLMLINIEHQDTDLTVYREGRFVFTRNISIGSSDFIDILGNQAQLAQEKPEYIKWLWGLEAQTSSLEEPEKSTFMKIRELLQKETDVFCKEIELTTYHFYQITHGERIGKCIILGEGSGIAGLVDFLKQRLEIIVEGFFIPETKLELAIEKREEFQRNLALYTQALGTLLIGPGDINLIAREKPQAKRRFYPFKFLAASKMTIVVSIFFVSLVLIIFIFLKGFNLYYRFQIRAYKIKQDKLQSQTLQLVEIKRKMDILDFEKKLYLRLVKERPVYPVIIEEICKAIPTGNVVLDELRFYSDRRVRSTEAPLPIKFTIIGRVLGKDVAGSETTRFVLALEQSGYFENISVTIREGVLPIETVTEERTGLSFAINGNIRLKD